MKEEIRNIIHRLPSRAEIEEDLIYQGLAVWKNGVLNITPEGLEQITLITAKCNADYLSIMYNTIQEFFYQKTGVSISITPGGTSNGFDEFDPFVIIFALNSLNHIKVLQWEVRDTDKHIVFINSSQTIYIEKNIKTFKERFVSLFIKEVKKEFYGNEGRD